jgi:hypothetical protein
MSRVTTNFEKFVGIFRKFQEYVGFSVVFMNFQAFFGSFWKLRSF